MRERVARIIAAVSSAMHARLAMWSRQPMGDSGDADKRSYSEHIDQPTGARQTAARVRT